MDKYIGKRLDGRYQLIELIGVGGMANVYRAQDVVEDRIVAVKVLRDEYAQNEEFLRRFKNESKAIAVLSHPNIVKVYDVSFFERVKYIVMEYIDGITLKDYLDQQGIIRWKEAIYFTVQILRALEHAHNKGIVHRDIKPHNIMLLSDGTIKITDFGIARFARNDTKTLTDKAIGSVHYISPEQASGSPTDERTDIYSLGVMIFEMLTGKLPFEADSPVSVALKQIQIRPPMPREFNPDIPEGLESIIMKAMEKNPDLRYQTSGEMLKDIGEFKRNPSIKFAYKYESELNYTEGNRINMKSSKKRNVNSKENKTSVPFLAVLSGVTAAFVIVTIAFILALFIIKKPFKVAPDMVMPNLVGVSYDDALNSKEFSDLEFELVESKYSAEYESGIILYQNPASGRNVKVGATAKVKVSKGAKIVTIPNFAGRNSFNVFEEIKQLDLNYEEFPVYSETVPKNNVVKTAPTSGENVIADTNVIVYVSQGPLEKTTRVPDLEGKTLDEAKELIKKYSLTLGDVKEVPSELEKGLVEKQIPSPSKKVKTNTKVDIEVSNGEKPNYEDMEDIKLKVWLPEMDDEVIISAYVDGEKVREESLTPSKHEKWQPTIRGIGEQEVKIYIDDKLYQVFDVDFDQHEIDLVDNYSNKFD